jgi:hypothetical protein
MVMIRCGARILTETRLWHGKFMQLNSDLTWTECADCYLNEPNGVSLINGRIYKAVIAGLRADGKGVFAVVCETCRAGIKPYPKFLVEQITCCPGARIPNLLHLTIGVNFSSGTTYYPGLAGFPVSDPIHTAFNVCTSGVEIPAFIGRCAEVYADETITDSITLINWNVQPPPFFYSVQQWCSGTIDSCLKVRRYRNGLEFPSPCQGVSPEWYDWLLWWADTYSALCYDFGYPHTAGSALGGFRYVFQCPNTESEIPLLSIAGSGISGVPVYYEGFGGYSFHEAPNTGGYLAFFLKAHQCSPLLQVYDIIRLENAFLGVSNPYQVIGYATVSE